MFLRSLLQEKVVKYIMLSIGALLLTVIAIGIVIIVVVVMRRRLSMSTEQDRIGISCGKKCQLECVMFSQKWFDSDEYRISNNE